MMTHGTRMFVALGMAAPLLVLSPLLSGCSPSGDADAPVLAPDYVDEPNRPSSGPRGGDETIDLGDLGDLTIGSGGLPDGTDTGDMPLGWDDPLVADAEGDDWDEGLADDMGEPEADWDTEGDAWEDSGYEDLDDAVFDVDYAADSDYGIDYEDDEGEDMLDVDYEDYGDDDEWYE